MNAENQGLGRAGWRRLWLQVHKWIGLLLAILIVPISLTGSALVWHGWLDEALNPARHVANDAVPALPASAYAAAASAALAPGERIQSIRYPDGEGPILVSAARPPESAGAGRRPVRTNVWLDPADGRVLDKAASDEGAVRFLHVLHGSLQVPDVGRQIVGWVGVAMLVSCLTGLWLWWPVTGSVRRGFRWRRQNATSANLHHQTGFWILIPLAMLSFTGVWISFPQFFGPLSGAEAPRAGPRPAPAQPLADTRLTADAAAEAAGSHATGALVSITWPTDKAPEWTIAFAREGGPAEIAVADAGGEVTPPAPPRPETIARTMRRWHDGDGMGLVWQVVIFVGGIIPALLAVTGIMMWLRARGWRRRIAKRRLNAAPAPAE